MTSTTKCITFNMAECCRCGVPFCISEDFEAKRRADHKDFYCPNGHSLHFPGKTEADKLQARLKFTQEMLDTTRAERDQLYGSLRSTKGHLTRARKQIAEGQCPCCHKTFKQLKRHMQRQHPDYVEEHGAHEEENSSG